MRTRARKRGLLLVLASLMALAVAASAKLRAEAPVPVIAGPEPLTVAESRSAGMHHATVPAARPSVSSLTDAIPLLKAKRQTDDKPPTADLFTQKSWYVPPPPPPKPKPLPPPPPTAPPMPFTFMGSYQAPNHPVIIFLTRGDRLYNVSPGDVIDGTYRVEGISSGMLEITYLPLNIKQMLAVKDAS